MGFGILFLGYLISINTLAYPGFTKIFALLLMLLSMSKLGIYNRRLKSAYITLIPATVIGVLYFALEVAKMFSFIPEDAATLLFLLIPLAVTVCELIFLFYLLGGLADLAKETEVPFLLLGSLRNRTLTVIYYVLFILGQFDYSPALTKFLIYYNVALLFVGFFIFFLNAKLIYGFYMWICLPGDENMNRKTSNIPFIDKLYERMDAAEERRLQRRQNSDAAYRQEKQARKENKKKK